MVIISLEDPPPWHHMNVNLVGVFGLHLDLAYFHKTGTRKKCAMLLQQSALQGCLRDSIEKSIENNVAILPAAYILLQALREFGSEALPAKRLLKILPILLKDQYQKVRDISKKLTLELCDWIGKSSIKVALFEKLSNTMINLDYERLLSLEWDYTFLDEGHKIKNFKSHISTNIQRIPSPHRIILSGTPIQNKYEELWALFHFCVPEEFECVEMFKKYIEVPIVKGLLKGGSAKQQHLFTVAKKTLDTLIKPYSFIHKGFWNPHMDLIMLIYDESLESSYGSLLVYDGYGHWWFRMMFLDHDFSV